MKHSILFMLICLLTISLFAQDRTISLPSWVQMIDNPKVNYYEAMNVFDLYWKDKVKPEGDDDKFEEHNNKKEERAREKFLKTLKKMTPSERQEYDVIQYHYKRFMTWAHDAKPFVQEDGRILTQEERIAIWNKQQAEINNQKK